MVCLDTSVLVAFIRKDQRAIERLKVESQGNGILSTTTVNLCELYAGAYANRDARKQLEEVQALVSRLRLLEFTPGAARRYGELVNDPGLKREPIGDFDLIIACIAIEHDERVATRNLKHFDRVPGLIAEEW